MTDSKRVAVSMNFLTTIISVFCRAFFKKYSPVRAKKQIHPRAWFGWYDYRIAPSIYWRRLYRFAVVFSLSLSLSLSLLTYFISIHLHSYIIYCGGESGHDVSPLRVNTAKYSGFGRKIPHSCEARFAGRCQEMHCGRGE
jgi:hypothetical protein